MPLPHAAPPCCLPGVPLPAPLWGHSCVCTPCLETGLRIHVHHSSGHIYHRVTWHSLCNPHALLLGLGTPSHQVSRTALGHAYGPLPSSLVLLTGLPAGGLTRCAHDALTRLESVPLAHQRTAADSAGGQTQTAVHRRWPRSPSAGRYSTRAVLELGVAHDVLQHCAPCSGNPCPPPVHALAGCACLCPAGAPPSLSSP